MARASLSLCVATWIGAMSCFPVLGAKKAPEKVEVWFSSQEQPGDGAWYKAPMPIRYALARQPDLALKAKSKARITSLYIDPSTRYQKVLGLGTSLEEASVFNLSRMSPGARTEALKALVDPDRGAGMNLMRICLGSSDYTGRAWYSYDDMPAGQTDPELAHFSIQKDIDYHLLDVIKEVLKLNPEIKIFASPWSPPGWMKDSGSMCGGRLKPEYYAVAARYFALAIQAYEKQGIPIHAFTLQNEPHVDTKNYPSAHYTWDQQRDFLKAVKQEFAARNLKAKLWILDHNFDMALDYGGKILADPEAYAATDGVAFHEYEGNIYNMSTLHGLYPAKDMLFTERAIWGVQGMNAILKIFRNWSCSYNWWVTMLDQNAKPNNGPFASGPTLLIQDTANPDHTWFIPEYYLFGQFTKFIRPGARRIFSQYGSVDTVTNVSFLNPDGSIVAVVVNQTPQAQPFRFVLPGRGGERELSSSVPATSVATYRWKPQDIAPGRRPLPPEGATTKPAMYHDLDGGSAPTAGASATVAPDPMKWEAAPGKGSLKLVVDSGGDPRDSERCAKLRPKSADSFDASSFEYMTFWVYDTQGSNGVKLSVVDKQQRVSSSWANADQRIQKNTWTLFVVPLYRITGIDLSAIREIRLGEWNQGTYYFSGIGFTNSPK